VVSRLDASDDPRLVLRRGTLLLDSDVPSTAEDMLRAAEAALWRGDSGLALRFAQAAMSSGSGWRASLACAEAFMMAGHLAEAQSVLDVNEISTEAVGPLAVGRATSLYLQRRTEDSHAALLNARSGHEEAGPGTATIDAMAAFLSVCDGDFVAATATADAALAQADLPDCSTMLASTAKTIALGELGRLDSLESTVTPARELGARSAATSFLRFALVDAQCSALQMLGLIGAAEAAIDVLRDDDQPQDVYRWVNMMSGSVSLASGRVDVAVGQLRSALSAQRPGFLGGWLCRYHVDLAIALAIRGESDAAKRCLGRLSSLPHPEMAFLAPMEMLATAWISASVGAVTRAIAEARNAAATAASRGLPVREVLCLQTATRFGDTTTAPRLNELVEVVDGCRVSAAAAHAAALAAGDGEELMAASLRYEATGDLLSAVDAAAHAGTMFRRVSRRGSALGAARRVHDLAERCGDVRTPAVADAAAPPIFSGREREVIMLAGRGLTNREIAGRLQLSVRTVEGHLYRAAGRVGARDRNELARVIGQALAVPA
jgi:DNA-binding NarL/FixJ family response regulator